MASLRQICEQRGVAIEKLLEFALENLEASKEEISYLEQEREILAQKIRTQQHLWAVDNQHFQHRLELSERMHKKRELTHAYEMAKSDLLHGAQKKDALLLEYRLDSALDDLEEFQTQNELLLIKLKEEQAGAQALNERLLEREKQAIADRQRSQIILELEEKTRSLQESLVKMEKDHCIEMVKVKSDRKRISSLRKHEVSALLRERDFVWNQLKIMEEDYANRLRSKTQQLQLASEDIENLRSTIEELQQANDEKNVELTILKVEMGESEREAQGFKENVFKKSISTDPLQELQSAVQIMKENKKRENKVLSVEGAGGTESQTDEGSPDLQLGNQ